MASKLLRAVVLGPPGSGKGTMCERIARSFGLQHLSSGQFLRESLCGGGEVGILAKQYLERGLLVPDHVITRVMMTELEKRREQHWLLDAVWPGDQILFRHSFASRGPAEDAAREKQFWPWAGNKDFGNRLLCMLTSAYTKICEGQAAPEAKI